MVRRLTADDIEWLARMLRREGIEVESSRYNAASFGHWLLALRGPTGRVRVHFDGRDEVLVVERWRGGLAGLLRRPAARWDVVEELDSRTAPPEVWSREAILERVRRHVHGG